MPDRSLRAPGDIRPRAAAWALLCILLAGAALRVLANLPYSMGMNTFSDDNAYLNSAAVFLKTGYVTYAVPDAQSGVLGVGMPLLLGALFSVFGYAPGGLMLSHIAFSMIGLCAAYGVYLLAALLHSRRAGLIGAAILALDAGALSAGCLFLTESPYLCLNLFTLYFSLRCASGWRLSSFLGAVLCLCGAMAFKGLALLAPLCALPLLARRRVPLSRWLPRACIALLMLLLVFLPWSVRNLQVVGAFTPFPVSQGDQKLLGSYVGLGAPAGAYAEDVAALNRQAWDQGFQNDVYRRIALRGALADARMAQWFREAPLGLIATHALLKPLTLLTAAYYPQKVLGIPARAVDALWYALLTLMAIGLLRPQAARLRRKRRMAKAGIAGDAQPASDKGSTGDAADAGVTGSKGRARNIVVEGNVEHTENTGNAGVKGYTEKAASAHPAATRCIQSAAGDAPPALQPGYYLPALYLLAAVLLTAMYVPLARYNAPHAPFVVCYAACALADGWAWLRGRGLAHRQP